MKPTLNIGTPIKDPQPCLPQTTTASLEFQLEVLNSVCTRLNELEEILNPILSCQGPSTNKDNVMSPNSNCKINTMINNNNELIQSIQERINELKSRICL